MWRLYSITFSIFSRFCQPRLKDVCDSLELEPFKTSITMESNIGAPGVNKSNLCNELRNMLFTFGNLRILSFFFNTDHHWLPLPTVFNIQWFSQLECFFLHFDSQSQAACQWDANVSLNFSSHLTAMLQNICQQSSFECTLVHNWSGWCDIDFSCGLSIPLNRRMFKEVVQSPLTVSHYTVKRHLYNLFVQVLFSFLHISWHGQVSAIALKWGRPT